MKLQAKHHTGHIRQLGLAALLATGLTLQAQTPIYNGHVDLGVAYDELASEWDLHVHDEENDIEYSPATDALVFISYDGHITVPAGSQWSFLGATGSSTWVLPNTENPNLPFLGIGSEEIDSGVFTGDQFSLYLKAVSGPGFFSLYDLDEFGDPILLMNSGDGITLADALTVGTGSHSHFNWAFSAAGDYTLTFEAVGDSILNGLTSSGNVDYLFTVQAVPEPSTFALAGLGLAALVILRRRTA
jgi:surface-anchored protein